MRDKPASVPFNAERPAVRAGRCAGAAYGTANGGAEPIQPAQEDGMRRFQDLGPAQQRFMLRAFSEGVALDDPLATHRRVTSLEGLIVKRQSKKGRTSWRLTDIGRGMVMAHTPVFLHRRGFPSYTHHTWQAAFAEPEVISAA